MEIDTQCSDLWRDLVDASLAFEVWREFTDENNRARFEATMQRFPRYFEATIHASLVTVITTCHRLFEDRRDTLNFHQFLRDASSERGFSTGVKNRVAVLNREIKPGWKKVCILRNNVVGHRSRRLAPESAFERAAITPDQLDDLLKRMKSLLSVVARAACAKRLAWNVSAKADITSLMAILARVR